MRTLDSQLREAKTRGSLPYCEHDELLMDDSGVQQRPPCGCVLGDHGLVERLSEPTVGRVSTEDLSRRLGESLVWIDLRVKLVTLLRKQADDGDPRARDQLDYVVRVWPGGGAPRAQEFAVQTQTVTNLCELLERVYRELAMHMEDSMIEEILTYLRNT